MDDPFYSAYDNFGRKLDEATHLVVIGYSFRDFGIVTKIKSSIKINTNLKVIIIDPINNSNDVRGDSIRNRDEAFRSHRHHYVLGDFGKFSSRKYSYISILQRYIGGNIKIGEYQVKDGPTNENLKFTSLAGKQFNFDPVNHNLNMMEDNDIVFLDKAYNTIKSHKAKFSERTSQIGLVWQYKDGQIYSFHYPVELESSIQLVRNSGKTFRYEKQECEVKGTQGKGEDAGEFKISFTESDATVYVNNKEMVLWRRHKANEVSRVGYWTYTGKVIFNYENPDGRLLNHISKTKNRRI